MKTLIIVSSTYLGNTMKVAKVMAHELNAILLTVREAEGHDIASYDLIGLGSGINFASHDKYIISLTERLNLSDKRVFIFSTRCRPFLGMYHKKLKSAVINRGGIVSVEFSCRGFDRTGPWVGINGYNKNRPDSNDIFRASLFAAGIKKKTHPIYHFRKYVTVSKSYKGLPVRIEGAAEVIGDIVMINNSECISCGKCIKSCPLNVFVREKETEKRSEERRVGKECRI